MKKFYVNSFHNQLRSQPWHQVYDNYSLEEAVKVWEELFMEVVNVHMPICQKRVKNKSSPWMCPEITKLISERDKLKSKARKVKVELFKATEESTKIELKKKQEHIWNRYKKLRNLVILRIRKRKRLYYTDKLSSASTSSEMWNILKSVMPKGRSNTSHPVNNVNDKSRADEFNRFSLFCKYWFRSIAANIPSSCPSVPSHGDSSNCTKQITSKFLFQPVTEDEVGNILSGMKNKKSVGVDGISMHMLKVSVPIIVTCLTYLFNKSLSEGDYPLRCKQAKIIPLHKSGDKSSPCNYRPIAILPSVSKILEKIACKQFSNYLKSKKNTIKETIRV